jgi:uncharacterized membrane protein YhhN
MGVKNMNKLRTVFVLLFIIDAAGQMASIFLGLENLRIVTKILLVPLLIGFYIASSSKPRISVVLAAAFGFAGDVLLIPNGSFFFLLGLLSFAAGHISYIVTFLSGIKIKWSVFIVSVCLSAALIVCIIFALKPDKGMLLPVVFYATLLFAMVICALQVMVYYKQAAAVLVFAGAVFFLLSDALLGLFNFGGISLPYSRALVMGTYIIAQGGILTGLPRLSVQC